MVKVIDLNCIKKEQEHFSKYLETTKGIINQINTMKVTERQILGLASELYEVVNEAKIHKEYDCDVNRDRVIEELSDCLSMIGNIANSLDMDLVINMEISKSKKIETQFIGLNYDILRLCHEDNISVARRRIKELIVPQFINIVFSLGFSLEDLIEAYFKKME